MAGDCRVDEAIREAGTDQRQSREGTGTIKSKQLLHEGVEGALLGSSPTRHVDEPKTGRQQHGHSGERCNRECANKPST